jgi:hypothetical protein
LSSCGAPEVFGSNESSLTSGCGKNGKSFGTQGYLIAGGSFL